MVICRNISLSALFEEEAPSENAPTFYDLSRRERSSLNTDLPTIPLHVLKQGTLHFSEDCKLGEGGFGTVYKVLICYYHYHLV